MQCAEVVSYLVCREQNRVAKWQRQADVIAVGSAYRIDVRQSDGWVCGKHAGKQVNQGQVIADLICEQAVVSKSRQVVFQRNVTHCQCFSVCHHQRCFHLQCQTEFLAVDSVNRVDG